MPTFAALLRGINVGPHRKLAMADLRQLLTELGHGEVRTHLNSGNALFTSGAEPVQIQSELEEAILKRLGMDVRVLVRSGAELQTAVEENPLLEDATDGSRMLAIFLSEAPDPALLAIHDPLALDPDRTRIGNRIIYQWCPDGYLAAPAVSGFVEKHLGISATARNWNTVTRLTELARYR